MESQNRDEIGGLTFDWMERELTITIVGVIGGVITSRKDQIENALTVAMQNRLTKVNLVISSEGGSADDALVIHSIIKSSPVPVHAYLVGHVMSAATVIACAADKVIALPSSIYMIHRAGISSNRRMMREDLLNSISQLEAIDSALVEIYAEKTGLDELFIRELMHAESFLTPSQAMALGFVDEIGDTAPIFKSSYYHEYISEQGTPAILKEGEVMQVTALAELPKPFKPANHSSTRNTNNMKFLNDLKTSILETFRRVEEEANQTTATGAGDRETRITAMLEKNLDFSPIASQVTAEMQTTIEEKVKDQVTAMVEAWKAERETNVSAFAKTETLNELRTENATLSKTVETLNSDLDALKMEIAAIKTGKVTTQASNGQPPVTPSGEGKIDKAKGFLASLGVQPL